MIKNSHSPAEEEQLDLCLSVIVGDNYIEAVLPIVTVSEANGGRKRAINRMGKIAYKAEHWTDKHTRHKKQRGMVHFVLSKYRKIMKLPCQIELTRYGAKKLDRHDNLPMSMKYILDACCELVTGDLRPGRADDSDEIEVKYDQVISSIPAVKIRFTFL